MNAQVDVIAVPAPGGGTVRAFALLGSLVIFARTFLHTVVPPQAYAMLGDVQAISILYFLASLGGVAGSLSIQAPLHDFARPNVNP